MKCFNVTLIIARMQHSTMSFVLPKLESLPGMIRCARNTRQFCIFHQHIVGDYQTGKTNIWQQIPVF